MRIDVKVVGFVLVIGALVIAGGAFARSGSTRARSFGIKKGDIAVFRLGGGGQYNCLNQGRQFKCVSGDALPDV